MSLLSKFDDHLVPETKKTWLVLFSICIGTLVYMSYSGYDDVIIGSRMFYAGIGLIIILGMCGIALGRGLKVWYQN